jgi:hypothetical protein
LRRTFPESPSSPLSLSQRIKTACLLLPGVASIRLSLLLLKSLATFLFIYFFCSPSFLFRNFSPANFFKNRFC